MMKYIKVVIVILAMSFVIVLFNSGNATEPERPDVNRAFDFEKEGKINEVVGLAPEEAFKRLKGLDFVTDENLLHKAIFKTFEHRSSKGIALALDYLKLPVIEIKKGKLVVDRTADFYVAKKIFEVFPDESVNKLLKLYNRGDAMVKGNIIRASGRLADGKRIKNLLIKALDDKTFCEEGTEMEGIPLRICDEAYNQLVLRYDIRNVLRTIGNVYTIEVRDYHIDILKEKLAALN